MGQEGYSEQDENFREQMDRQPEQNDEQQQGQQHQPEQGHQDEEPKDKLKNDAQGVAEKEIKDRFKF